jgi:hypothetical protein
MFVQLNAALFSAAPKAKYILQWPAIKTRHHFSATSKSKCVINALMTLGRMISLSLKLKNVVIVFYSRSPLGKGPNGRVLYNSFCNISTIRSQLSF